MPETAHICLYYTLFNDPLPASSFRSQLEALPADLRQRISKFKKWEDQHASLFGKLLLSQLLLDHGLGNDLARLRYSKKMRPSFNDTWDFNISHTQGCVVCVMTRDYRVGVDVEKLTALNMTDFDGQWTIRERQRLNESHEPIKTFYWLWTRKEAVLKADGRGLHIPLDTIDVLSNSVEVEGTTWHIESVPIAHHYHCSVAHNILAPITIDARYKNFYAEK